MICAILPGVVSALVLLTVVLHRLDKFSTFHVVCPVCGRERRFEKSAAYRSCAAYSAAGLMKRQAGLVCEVRSNQLGSACGAHLAAVKKALENAGKARALEELANAYAESLDAVAGAAGGGNK